MILEKVGGNDTPMLSEQIMAITDKLLEYERITTNQHQNLQSTFDNTNSFSWLARFASAAPSVCVSAFTKKDLFVD